MTSALVVHSRPGRWLPDGVAYRLPAMDDALGRLATAQGGVFTTAQAAAIGVSSHELHRLVGARRIERVRAGAYLVPAKLAEDERRRASDEAYLRRVRAVVHGRLATGKVWASHHAGLIVHGLPSHGADLQRVDLAVKEQAHTWIRSGVRTATLPADEHVMLVRGVPVCSVVTCLVQTAAASGLEAGVVAMDAALREELVTVDELRRRVVELGRFVGIGSARAAVARCNGLAESVGESRARLLMEGLGVTPRSQVEIFGPRGELLARVDFLLDQRVIVEFDGAVKYAGAEGRAAIVAEKAREDRLRAEGYEVVRLVWADLEDPERVAKLIRQARWRAECRALGVSS